MSEKSSINENDTSLDILCDDAMDMENVAVIKSSGKHPVCRSIIVFTINIYFVCSIPEMILSPTENSQSSAGASSTKATPSGASTSQTQSASTSSEAPVCNINTQSIIFHPFNNCFDSF